MNIFKRKKRVNGQVQESNTYYGRFRVKGMAIARTVNLHCTDKSVALRKLSDCIVEAEKEAAGTLDPKSVRDASKTPLSELLAEYLADLKALKRSEAYLRQCRVRPTRLFKECRWVYLRDITPESFSSWRARQKLAQKTIHEHLAQTSSFLRWLLNQRRIRFNPLDGVTRIPKTPERLRRAYTPDEITRLMEVAGSRRIVYLMAIYTGLRRAELHALCWADFHSQNDESWLLVRGATTKNGKDATIPLPANLGAELVILRESRKAKPADLILGSLIPRLPRFRKDQKLAFIPAVDEMGRHADFHSFRLTYCMLLHNSGALPRVAQELMRHSDARLTNSVYTTTSQLPLAHAVSQLPWLGGKVTLKVTTNADTSGHDLSQPCILDNGDLGAQPAGVQDNSPEKSPNGTTAHNRKNLHAEGIEPPTLSV